MNQIIEVDPKEKIFDVVCDIYNVSKDDLKSKCRKRSIVEPRQIIMYFLNKKTDMFLREIGAIFNTDHTDVVYARKAVNALYDTDKMYHHRIKYIEGLIN